MTSMLDAVLAEAARGGRPDGILLMRLLAEAATEEEARAALDFAIAARAESSNSEGASRLARLRRLWAANPQAWPVVRSVLAVASHEPTDVSPADTLRRWAGVFDRLAVDAPEAGVALYSFGRADLLEAATGEIVGYLDRLDLLGPTRDVLDLGCGIGRIAAALAPRVKSVLGTDLSAGMIAEARRRFAHLANVHFEQSDGTGLATLAADSLDLVVAADVFPYLVQAGAGLAEAHVEGFARCLRAGGSALILNFSYRGDAEADRRDVEAMAGKAALQVVRNGGVELELWDATTFLLRKPA